MKEFDDIILFDSDSVAVMSLSIAFRLTHLICNKIFSVKNISKDTFVPCTCRYSYKKRFYMVFFLTFETGYIDLRIKVGV